MIDKKARKILFSKYWDPSKGWTRKELSEDDYNYALKAGYMFDDIVSSHDETIENCINTILKTSKEKVVKAFISSLTSRRLDLRSALSSYACGERLYHHSHKLPKKACEICGEYESESEIDLNVLNFERHKFGGVRHLKPTYINLDLNIFSTEKVEDPKEEDISILKESLNSLESLKSGKLSDSEKVIKGLFKANKDERVSFIETLGYCGILTLDNYQPFYKAYIPYNKREESSYSKSDWSFPADIWLPEKGLCEQSINYWFKPYIGNS